MIEIKKYILVLFLVLPLFTQAQNKQIELHNGKDVFYIPIYEKKDAVYFSLNHFCQSTLLNYSIDTVLRKFIIRYNDKSLTLAGNNHYVIYQNKANGDFNMFQLPVSNLMMGKNLFVHSKYITPILSSFLEREVELREGSKLFVENVKVETKKDDLVKTDSVEIKKPIGFDITGLLFDVKVNGTLLKIKAKNKIKSYSSSVKDNQLTIVLRNVTADIDKINKITGKGVVKSLTVKNVGTNVEIKLNLAKDFTRHELLNISGSNDMLVTLHNNKFDTPAALEKKNKWIFDAVVIDAGHGGKDAGAIGINGIKEKDINLDVALRLGELIKQNMPDVKVHYTRDDDNFVELYKRGKIANEKDGKLFISIHCNSTADKNSSATGFEVYLLRPGRTSEAIKIAELENSVIQYEDDPNRYKKLNDENFILVSMAHASYMKYAEKFSGFLHNNFSNFDYLTSRGVKQAGFYVLVGTSMPSVLIETGFLSNKQDAEYLSSKKGRQKTAELIFQGVKEFKSYYEEEITKE